jgi:hypothetical protein
MTTSHNVPGWATALMVRLAPVGIRTVVKRGNKIYRYRYLRLDARAFPEVANVRRLRVLIAPPDFSAPPVLVTARVIKQGVFVQGYSVDAAYQPVVEKYVRNGYVAVLYVEIIEPKQESGTP